ncbi:MAG: terpene cyclase/mutase family protein, partial [Clostridiales Family XIII bacterium]|nr:terpene cyclase/mutase family protein [Clostridiales Family XIII bacterium]
MGNNRIKRWTALLLAAVMFIALPAPASLAASADEAKTALQRTFTYYKIQQDGVLSGGFEVLAAAFLTGENLTDYVLPTTSQSALSSSLLIALMKGDTAGAAALAEELAGNLNKQDYITTDAMELIAIEAYNRSALASLGAYSPVVYAQSAAVSRLLDAEEVGGGFGFGSGDPDTTGMVLAALALFNTDAYPAVQAAVSRALDYLRGAQQENGGFSAWGENNANSAAAVIWGLCALKQDMNAWSKNGKTPVDALLSFQTEQGGFGYANALENDLVFATPQAALALALVTSGRTFFTDLTAGADLYKGLSVGVADRSGAYHERSVTVKRGERLSTALARALRTSNAVNASDYYCRATGALLSSEDLSGLADGAEILAIHKSFENAAYFLTGTDDGFGVNTAEIPFGASQNLTLRIASAGAVSAAVPLAGVGVDGDGDGFWDAKTDAAGRVTLSFIAAGTHSVRALPAGVPGGTALLPARITV